MAYTMGDKRAQELLELLINVSREVASALDLRTVLYKLLFASIKNVGCERGSIIVLDDNLKPVESAIVYGGQQTTGSTTQQLRATVDRGLAGWVVKNHKAALVPDTSQDKRWLKRADDSDSKTGPKSAICVPLITRDKLVGVLTLVHPTPNSFEKQHLELMQAIADQASVAVLNARLFTESERKARIMTALANGAAAINSSLELGEVWRGILNQTMKALQVETVALALIDHSNNDDLVFYASQGHKSDDIPGKRISSGHGLGGRVVKIGSGLIIEDPKPENHFAEMDAFGDIEIRSIAVAPIQYQEKVIGVLEAINPGSGSFSDDAMVVMTGLGSLAGTTIQNAQLYNRLQKAHQHYHELFNSSVDPILITNWNGKILEANRQAITLSGYPVSQLHLMDINQLHDINWEKTGNNFESLKNDFKTSYESTLHQRDGGRVPIEVHVQCVENEESIMLQWILRDIRERKELDSLRDDMTAMVVHDLRNPLNNIIGSLDLLDFKDGTDQKIMIAARNIALSSTGRLQRLVNSLLDINRFEAGQPITSMDAVDAGEVIHHAVQDARPLTALRHLEIENNVKNTLPLVWIDADMIYRVFVNLLENADKYANPGGQNNGKIEIGSDVLDANFVKFWVRDNGKGIAPENLERIFDKFTRLRNSEKLGGLGVGLAFCKLAIVGHGGKIWVESELGKGSTFYFTLPIAHKKPTGELKRHTGQLKMNRPRKFD